MSCFATRNCGVGLTPTHLHPAKPTKPQREIVRGFLVGCIGYVYFVILVGVMSHNTGLFFFGILLLFIDFCNSGVLMQFVLASVKPKALPKVFD